MIADNIKDKKAFKNMGDEFHPTNHWSHSLQSISSHLQKIIRWIMEESEAPYQLRYRAQVLLNMFKTAIDKSPNAVKDPVLRFGTAYGQLYTYLAYGHPYLLTSLLPAFTEKAKVFMADQCSECKMFDHKEVYQGRDMCKSKTKKPAAAASPPRKQPTQQPKQQPHHIAKKPKQGNWPRSSPPRGDRREEREWDQDRRRRDRSRSRDRHDDDRKGKGEKKQYNPSRRG